MSEAASVARDDALAGGVTRTTRPRRESRGRSRRLGIGVVLLTTFAVAGCADIASTPYDPVEACRAVGGIYRPSGQCRAGLD
jgi:hypothetical protein